MRKAKRDEPQLSLFEEAPAAVCAPTAPWNGESWEDLWPELNPPLDAVEAR